VPDLDVWLPLAGIQLAPGARVPSRAWFQALSLIGHLTPPAHESK
jgi:hypothetical protein